MDTPKGVHKFGDFSKFPDEIVIEILKKLDAESLAKVCSVSKRMNRLCKDNYLWKRLYYSDISPTDPCLPLEWAMLYEWALSGAITLYILRIEAHEFFVIGAENLDPTVDRHLKTVFQYDDDEIELLHSDLLRVHGDSSIEIFVNTFPFYYTDNDLSLEIQISEIAEIPFKDILNLFPNFKEDIKAFKQIKKIVLST